MIDLEQMVTIKWYTRNKQKYMDLGYKFTKLSDLFDVKVKDLDKNTNVKVKVKCDDCGKEIITPYRNYNKIIKKSGRYRCKKCNAPFVSQIRIHNNTQSALEDFNNLTTKLGYIPLAKEDDYMGCDIPMPFLCPKHGEQKLSTNQLRQGTICPECGKRLKGRHFLLSKEEVKQIVASKNNNILINPDDYINCNIKNLKIKCGSCGNIFLSSLSSIQNGGGHCKECALKQQSKTARLKIEDVILAATIDGVCYIVNPQDYINAYTRNLFFHCISCGEIFSQSLGHYKDGDRRCSKCISKISVGENKIMNILDKNNINFISQKRFNKCRDKKPLPFDFFLPDFNICIEFDGFHHYKENSRYSRNHVEKTQKHDRIKDDFCKINGINLIRIPYWEFKNIENILINSLKINIIV